MQGLMVLTLAALLVGCIAVPQQDDDQNQGDNTNGGSAGNFDDIDQTRLPLPDNNRRYGHTHRSAVDIPASCQCTCQLFEEPISKPSYRPANLIRHKYNIHRS